MINKISPKCIHMYVICIFILQMDIKTKTNNFATLKQIKISQTNIELSLKVSH